jgi:hypothetical protein
MEMQGTYSFQRETQELEGLGMDSGILEATRVVEVAESYPTRKEFLQDNMKDLEHREDMGSDLQAMVMEVWVAAPFLVEVLEAKCK